MRWLLILVAFFVIVALALAWGASFFAPDQVPLAWPSWATFLVVFTVLLVLLARWGVNRWRGVSAARKARAGDPREAALEGWREARMALQKEVRDEVLALQKAGGSLGGRRRADRPPCYLVIGAAGAGKTSLLERAGLPLLAQAERRAVKRGAPAAPVAFWSSRDAIFLEVAGSLAGEPGADANEAGGEGGDESWSAVLEGVRLARPEAPLQGVIVVANLAPLVAGSSYDRTQAAGRLRARVEQVKERLEVLAPVYVVFTHADAVAGFSDFWGDLGAEQRGQAWGAAFAVDDPRLAEASEPLRGAREELTTLVSGLHTRLLDRLPSERNPARRARILRFPVELRGVAEAIAQFVGQLGQVSDTRAGEQPRIRGFYFVGASLAGVSGKSAAPAPLAPRDPRKAAPASAAEATSYFVKDIFAQVVIPDRGLVAQATSHRDRRSRRDLVLIVATLVVSVVILFPAMVSYFRNVQVARDVQDTAALLASPPPGSVAGMKGDPVEPLLDALVTLDDAKTGFGVPGWFGPRAPRELEPSIEEAYFARLGLDQTIARKVNADFAELARARALDDPSATRFYESLKLYVMLSAPKDRLVEPAARQWAATHIASLWRAALSGRDTVADERLTAHAARYVGALAGRPQPFLRLDAKELARARAKLVELRVKDLPYHWLIAHAVGQPGVDVPQVFETSVVYLQPPTDQRVQGVYSAAGYPAIRDAIEDKAPWPDEIVIERWVIGDVSIPENEDALRATMRQRYYEEYRKEWKAFLRTIHPKTPRDLKSARKEIATLADLDGPYPRLFETIKANAIHPQPTVKEELIAHAKKALFSCQSPLASATRTVVTPPASSPVEDFFRPFVQFGFGDEPPATDPAAAPATPAMVAAPSSRLGRYLKTLREVASDLDNLAQAGGAATANTEFPTRMNEAKRATRAIFDEVNDNEARDVLVQMLGLSIEASADIGKHEAAKGVSADWRTAVYAVWQDRLAPRYPFRKGTTDSVTMEEFATFFRPDTGTLWKFVATNLGDRVERSNDHYALKAGPEPLRPEVLPCLGVAQEITDAFFADGPNANVKLSVEVDWSSMDVSGAKFWLDEKATALSKGDWSPTLTWTGQSVKLEWAQAGRPAIFELGRGTFSLFDLLERSDGLTAAGSGGARRHYVAQFPPVTLKVRSDEKVDMFRPDFFTRLRCPPEIVTTGN